MPVPFWKIKGKGRPKADGSSASESGDSPTSTASPQSQIPDPIDGGHSGQPSSSRRNESTHPSIPGIGTSIIKRADGHGGIDRPIQPVSALDYQPPEYRDLPPPSASSKRIYNMPVPNAQTDYDDLYNRRLDTFKFGSPSITTMTDTSSQIDPRSSQEEFPHPGADTTPRPSLAVHPGGFQGHPLQVAGPSHPSPGIRHRPERSDASSVHTFGETTSASASVSSLADPGSSGLSQTGQEASQEQSSDDEPHVRYHHPPYLESLYSSSSVDSSFTREDFYYYDDEDLSDPDIGPAHQDESDSFDESYWNPPPDQDSFIADYLSQRRGSNPIPIPGVQDGHFQGRDREDSVATVKYPMTSAPGPSRIDRISLTAVAPDSMSLPAHDAVWDQRMQAVQGRKDSPTTARPHPPIHAMDYDSAPLPNFVHPFEPSTSQLEESDNAALEFDPREWGNIASGIKGGADLGDVDAAPLGAGNVHTFWSRFAANDAPRRPSIASTINDTFQKHALAFKDQDWSFRKDKADGSALAKKKRNTFIPFNERPLKRGPPWRGMAVGQTEYWRNELTGIYKVERLEIPAGESRPPQQRLSIHHQRDGTRQAQRPTPGLLYDPHNGPTTTIHKHSKAAAFSLSRHYRDKAQSKSADRHRANQSRVQPLRNAVYVNSKKTAMILLAPRKVQEAYTSTTTTRKLESHGLLGDAYRSRDVERWKRLVEEDDKLKEKQKVKEKAKREKEQEKQRKAAEEKARKDKGRVRARGQDSTVQSEPTSLGGVETVVSGPSANPAPPAAAPPASSVAPARVASDVDTPNTQAQVSRPSAPPLDVRNISSSSSVTVPASESDLPPRAPIPTSADSSTSDPSTAAVPPARMRAAPLPAPQLQHSPSGVSGHTLINPEASPFSREYYYSEEQEEEIDEEDEQLGLVPRRRKRTPHNEAYHSLSPESIDSFASQQESHSRGFLPWFSGRNASSRTLKYEAPYNPPWLSAPSRPNNHEMQMQVVAGLNTSFQGVGLLPTDKEIRESRRRRAMKSQARDATRTERRYTREKDIFIDLPDDALYMLLPLWPSETDPVSNRDKNFELPTIPIHERLYALVYYKPWYPPESSGKGKGKDKTKRSRGSLTASQDGIYMDERNVLMNQFYIGARIVAYDDLEGSNVRVPELGLSVVGPLEESLATIPLNKGFPRSKKGDKKGKGRDDGQGKEFWDFIIGSYHSRDHPMEFYPEGFKRMGLATQEATESATATEASDNAAGPSRLNGTDPTTPSDSESSSPGSIKGAASINASTSSLPSIPPGGTKGSKVDVNEIAPFNEPGPSNNPVPLIRFPHNSEEEPIQEPPIILTPIGRAVLEMAFMGALAVTGFAPQPYW